MSANPALPRDKSTRCRDRSSDLNLHTTRTQRLLDSELQKPAQSMLNVSTFHQESLGVHYDWLSALGSDCNSLQPPRNSAGSIHRSVFYIIWSGSFQKMKRQSLRAMDVPREQSRSLSKGSFGHGDPLRKLFLHAVAIELHTLLLFSTEFGTGLNYQRASITMLILFSDKNKETRW